MPATAVTSSKHSSGRWSVGARSETGYVRKSNEDRMEWVRTPYGEVFLIADGMGGYSGGAKAARITIDTLKEHLSKAQPQNGNFSEQVMTAFQAANHQVHSQRQADDPETREMGATGLAVVTSAGQFCVAHVGDSRAYRWRPGMPLQRLTRDHSHVQSLVDAGVMSEAEAAQHPDASVLERAIGHQQTVQAEVSPWIPLKHGDRILLCSDGLSGFVQDAEIESILRAHRRPQPATDRLVECALSKGGEDNVTVQLARYSLPWSQRPWWWLGLTLAVVAVLVGLVVLFDRLRGRVSNPLPPESAASAASAAAPKPASAALPASDADGGRLPQPVPIETVLPSQPAMSPSIPSAGQPASNATGRKLPAKGKADGPAVAASRSKGHGATRVPGQGKCSGQQDDGFCTPSPNPNNPSK